MPGPRSKEELVSAKRSRGALMLAVLVVPAFSGVAIRALRLVRYSPSKELLGGFRRTLLGAYVRDQSAETLGDAFLRGWQHGLENPRPLSEVLESVLGNEQIKRSAAMIGAGPYGDSEHYRDEAR